MGVIAKRINLMTRQIQELVQLTKLQVVLEEIFIPHWTKVLTNPEAADLKTAKTKIAKVVMSIVERTDTNDLKSYVHLLNNSRLVNLPPKEYEQMLKTLENDTAILDAALSCCNPCKVPSPTDCELRKTLSKHNYPAVWDDNYKYMHELNEYEKQCLHHCGYCMNVKLNLEVSA